MSKIKLLLDVVNDMEWLTGSLRNLAKSLSGSEETDNKSTVSEVSLEDVRAVLVQASQNGKTSEVKTLLTKYGATKLSEIEPNKLKSLLAEAKVLANA